MHDRTVKMLSTLHTGLYRASGGRVGRKLPRVDGPMLLLTTTGRHSGRAHSVPLLYVGSAQEPAVIASYGGRDHHPDWYRNLVFDPVCGVQVDQRRFTARARDTHNSERDRLWSEAVAAYPGYATYQARTERLIPVVVLGQI